MIVCSVGWDMHQTEYILSFESTYDAMTAEQALLQASLPVRVMPLPAAIRAGCGICLRIAPDAWPQADAILCGEPIRPPSIHLRTITNGKSHYTPCPKGDFHEPT